METGKGSIKTKTHKGTNKGIWKLLQVLPDTSQGESPLALAKKSNGL
jgi:hypothetical protein